MKTVPGTTDPLATLRQLSLAEVEQRLAELDAERAALSTLRRSIAARDRAKQRAHRTAPTEEGRRNG